MSYITYSYINMGQFTHLQAHSYLPIYHIYIKGILTTPPKTTPPQE